MNTISKTALALALACLTLFAHARQWSVGFSPRTSACQGIPRTPTAKGSPRGGGDAHAPLLHFLYAYMPLSDSVDHSRQYWERQVSLACLARREMPWGGAVPEREFRHFVLPVRVNNEDLDTSRDTLYRELRDRVRTLTMEKAVLEVNHYCHERATYQPSDARTSGPLATMRSATGRCGEESTLLVAALRAVCIPARQVYTPRWAHTDDNHAWVEAWADGRWHFLGACEPEPVLDLGWFNAPASRAMLMHTKVFGRYDGPEEVIARTPRYTEINVTANYARTARAVVRVVDGDRGGQPVPGATVDFKVYNYAEYCTVVSRQSGTDGCASLTAGLGDMVVWASKDGRFGFDKLTFGQRDTLTISLTSRQGSPAVDIDLTPPAERARLPRVTPAQRAECDIRLAREDSIRGAYTATFRADDTDPEVAALLAASRGNHAVIRSFVDSLRREGRRDEAVSLLRSLSKKDLRDVTRDVLDDWLGSTPRVSNERLTPCRSYFRRVLPPELRERFASDPGAIARWTADSITIDPDCNLGACPISPRGVWLTRRADSHSRDIFYVSLARALGAEPPAPTAGSSGPLAQDKPKGRLRATYSPIPYLPDPKYYTHFTLSRLTEDGRLRLLDFDEDTTSWSSLLRPGLDLEAGRYALVTGTRLANGGVLSRLQWLTVGPDEETTAELTVRTTSDQVQVIGQFDAETKYTPARGAAERSVLSVTGRGYYVIGLIAAGGEPSNHALRDIEAVAPDLAKWGRPVLLLFRSEAELRKFRPQDFKDLPSNVSFGADTSGSVARQLSQVARPEGGAALPLIAVADTFNRVVFVSEGYNIGLGEKILAVANSIRN